MPTQVWLDGHDPRDIVHVFIRTRRRDGAVRTLESDVEDFQMELSGLRTEVLEVRIDPRSPIQLVEGATDPPRLSLGALAINPSIIDEISP